MSPVGRLENATHRSGLRIAYKLDVAGHITRLQDVAYQLHALDNDPYGNALRRIDDAAVRLTLRHETEEAGILGEDHPDPLCERTPNALRPSVSFPIVRPVESRGNSYFRPMKKSRFSEAKIISVLQRNNGGEKVSDLCREISVSDATFYNWKAKYGGLSVSELKRIKSLRPRMPALRRCTLSCCWSTRL